MRVPHCLALTKPSFDCPFDVPLTAAVDAGATPAKRPVIRGAPDGPIGRAGVDA
jgi:hypothetical protein